MNAAEYKMAFTLAKSTADLSNVNIDHLFGYGLKDFEPTTTTLEAIAALMRWQSLMFNGQWDMEELENIRLIGKKKFIVIDGEFAVVPGTYTPDQLTGIRAAARLIDATRERHQ